MKKRLLLFACVLALGVNAQQDVYLEIQHELNGQPFTMGDQGQNNLGDNFNVTRLEYYICQISVTHDGGQVASLQDTYFLVDGSQAFNELLGDFNISQIESVTFAVGVDSARNFLDPAAWPMAHPLSPKSPSMHWGWTAGYLYAVMEGASGAGLSQNYEFHALGLKNFTYQTIQTSGETVNGDLVIRLIADYAEAFYNIPLDQGMIQHGQDDEAAEFLGNFSVRVFESSDGNGPVASIAESNEDLIRAFPNPAARQVTIDASSFGNKIDRYMWINASGAVVAEGALESATLSTPKSNGIYMLSLFSGKEKVAMKRIVVLR